MSGGMWRPATHAAWKGNPRQYQLRAQELYSQHHERSVLPWSWITTDCEVDLCLNPEHMLIHAPVRIAYRPGVCTYCGEGCAGVDHLLPEPWTGKALRHMVAVVPACGNCNARINDHPSPEFRGDGKPESASEGYRICRVTEVVERRWSGILGIWCESFRFEDTGERMPARAPGLWQRLTARLTLGGAR